MPEIQDINDFKNDLLRLGNEPEIREQRGESMPDITVPESEAVEELSALFDDLADDSETFDESVVPEEDFTGESPADEAEPSGIEYPEQESAAEEQPEEDFEDDMNAPEALTDGFGDIFGELDGIEPIEDTGTEEDVFGELDGIEPIEDTGTEEDVFGDLEGFDDVLPDVSEPDEEFNPDEFSGDFDFPAESGDQEDEFSGFDEIPDSEQAGEESAVFDEADALSESEGFDLDGIESFDEDGDFGFSDEKEDSVRETGMFDTSELDMPETDDTEFGEEAEPSDEFDTDISDLDTGDFAFDESAASGDGEPGEEDEFSLEDFSLGEIDGDDIEASEFSLGDLGEEFGIDDEEEHEIGRLEDLAEEPEAGTEDFGDAYSDDTYAIPDDEYVELKKTLGQMPRNLKLIIEELIGEKHLSGSNLDRLLQALIRGASAREVGAVVSKITGKKIKIPAQYERRSAEEFEKEKESFGYAFRKNFIPMFRAASIAAVLLGLILFLGYRFVYTPLHAQSLYKSGYEEIPLGNNDQANAYFERAFSEWRRKDWFYRYAESFAEQKQYVLAEEKYQQLLGWYPDEREAVLDYAELEFKTLGKYPEAESLLQDLLFDSLRDYDARLMLGDTYMEWAREIDSAKYEEARFNYAKLLEQFGSRDELLFRMLRYFIRTNNHDEAMNLYRAFRQNDKASVEPDIYAELAGYLIDNNQLEDVREILMKARSIDEEIPEIHYEMARYFDIIDIPFEEEKALNAAIWLFENTSPLTRTRNGMLIDSYNRFGQILYQQEKYLDAESYFSKAAASYDEALAAGQIKPEIKYGNIFSNLGDLSYYISGDYEQALRMFEKAERNAYSPPVLKYKKGYIHYVNEDYRDALVEFYDTAGGFSVERGLMYSTANALFNRNDYFLAEGYYTHLLDILDKEYSSINYLLIDEIPEHRALLENMMKVSNNLGVTKYRLYERNRDPEKNAEAMVLLTDSMEYYDKLTRDPDLLVEPDSVNLSYLNSRAVFFPVPDYRLQIYQDIPKDLDKIHF